jgi:hypothetical protein
MEAMASQASFFIGNTQGTDELVSVKLLRMKNLCWRWLGKKLKTKWSVKFLCSRGSC